MKVRTTVITSNLPHFHMHGPRVIIAGFLIVLRQEQKLAPSISKTSVLSHGTFADNDKNFHRDENNCPLLAFQDFFRVLQLTSSDLLKFQFNFKEHRNTLYFRFISSPRWLQKSEIANLRFLYLRLGLSKCFFKDALLSQQRNYSKTVEGSILFRC